MEALWERNVELGYLPAEHAALLRKRFAKSRKGLAQKLAVRAGKSKVVTIAQVSRRAKPRAARQAMRRRAGMGR